jgi:hypothetical protein
MSLIIEIALGIVLGFFLITFPSRLSRWRAEKLITKLDTWNPPAPSAAQESCIEADTGYSVARERWLQSSPVGSSGSNNPMRNGRAYSILTAWHHDASARKNARDMAQMGDELKAMGVNYSHIWRKDACGEYPAFAVNSDRIENEIGKTILAEDAEDTTSVSRHRRPLTAQTYGLQKWRDFLLEFDADITFFDYRSTFQRFEPFKIAPAVQRVLDGHTIDTASAVFAIRDGAIFGWWLDDFHNYLTIAMTEAEGAPCNHLAVISLGQDSASPSTTGSAVPSSEVAATQVALNDYLERKAQRPSPQLQAKRARLLNKLYDLFRSSAS